MNKMRTFIVSLLFVSVALSLVACSVGGAQEALPTATPIPTAIVPIKPTYVVQRGEVIQELNFSGRVAPVIEAELFFQASGRVRNVYFEEGDFVEADQLIADLDFLDDLERQFASNQLSLRRAEISVENAQYALDLFVMNTPLPEVLQAQASQALSDAEVAVEAAERALRLTPASASEAQQSLAAANLAVAEARLLEAQAEWERIQINPVPKGYEEELALRQNQLELAQISLSETEIGMADLEAAIADAQIIAPFSGVLRAVNVNTGRTVEAFKSLVVIADLTALEISANLTSQDLEGVEEGMQVIAEFVSRPGDAITGVVRRLPYLAGGSTAVDDNDQTTRITTDIPLDELDVEVGDLVRITIVIAERPDTLWLPPQAIRVFEGRRFVVVQEEGFQQRVDIKLGIEGQERIEILEGLEEGQIVVSP
ncbi:MAG: efflux RND transporter periplasmic adaptor subunit [Anaerolineales bacterium]|nr:efflux RND transporter periplasmic adaptor subunit [Anaerolineales bacterium]